MAARFHRRSAIGYIFSFLRTLALSKKKKKRRHSIKEALNASVVKSYVHLYDWGIAENFNLSY
jgi:hypothetical protein